MDVKHLKHHTVGTTRWHHAWNRYVAPAAVGATSAAGWMLLDFYRGWLWLAIGLLIGAANFSTAHFLARAGYWLARAAVYDEQAARLRADIAAAIEKRLQGEEEQP